MTVHANAVYSYLSHIVEDSLPHESKDQQLSNSLAAKVANTVFWALKPIAEDSGNTRLCSSAKMISKLVVSSTPRLKVENSRQFGSKGSHKCLRKLVGDWDRVPVQILRSCPCLIIFSVMIISGWFYMTIYNKGSLFPNIVKNWNKIKTGPNKFKHLH